MPEENKGKINSCTEGRERPMKFGNNEGALQKLQKSSAVGTTAFVRK